MVPSAPPDSNPPPLRRLSSTHGTWIAAAEANRSAERRDIILPPPTWATLREIERLRSVDEILESARHRRIQPREPKVVQRDGASVLIVPGDLQETAFVWTDGHLRPAATDAERRSWGV